MKEGGVEVTIGVDLAKLELMERRVFELEKYLGIDEIDLEAFGLGASA